MFLKYDIELTIQIDFISVSLEFVIDCSKEPLLNNEFFNIIDFTT